MQLILGFDGKSSFSSFREGKEVELVRGQIALISVVIPETDVVLRHEKGSLQMGSASGSVYATLVQAPTEQTPAG